MATRNFHIAVLVLLWPSAAAPAESLKLIPEERARAVRIVDGDTLVLADRRQVRLVGIQVTTRFVAFHLGSSASLEARMKPYI